MHPNYHEIRLLDPHNPKDYPRLVAKVGFLLRQPRTSLGDVEPLGDAIERVFEPDERERFLNGERYLTADECCARCGGDLGIAKCNGCGRPFRDDQSHSPGGVSLPPVLRKWFIDHGNTFTD